MDNWSKLFKLLTEEIALWRECQRETERQLSAWREKDMTPEEAESYLTRQEHWQALIAQNQTEAEQLRAVIEAAGEELSSERRERLEEVIQAREELRALQAKLSEQVRELQEGLRSFGEKQRAQIRTSRSRQAAQQTYQTVPALEESALLDQKK